MTSRFGLSILALLALAACEDFTDLVGVGSRDPIQYGDSADLMEL